MLGKKQLVPKGRQRQIVRKDNRYEGQRRIGGTAKDRKGNGTGKVWHLNLKYTLLTFPVQTEILKKDEV